MSKVRVRRFSGFFVVMFAVVCGAGMDAGRLLAQTNVASGGVGVLAQQIEALVGAPEVARAHWGVMVAGMDGTRIYELNEGQLFEPASNVKLFTTAAALAVLGPHKTFETRVVARGRFASAGRLDGELVLVGGGDANLSGRTLPYIAPGDRPKGPAAIVDPLRYLGDLADQVAATGLKKITGDVVGDDTLFRYEPYAVDWAIDDTVWGYGAPVSALAVNDNQMKLTVIPGSRPGDAALITLEPEAAYYTIDGSVSTGAAKSGGSVQVERRIGSKVLRVYGSIAVNAGPDVEEIAIDDPAEYGAMVLKKMLEERGIVVMGGARAEHMLPSDSRGFLEQTREPLGAGLLDGTPAPTCGDASGSGLARNDKVIATHRSVELGEDIVVTNKVSENLHAEMLLHDLGESVTCVGSTAQGARVVRQFLSRTGVDGNDFVFFDGSGMSGHDLVTPRAVVQLLQYAAGQPWYATWRASLPVGGVDGTLAGRFTQAPLKGKVFAKTGTNSEARALSGYVECASGKMVAFSVMVGSYVPGNHSVQETIDKIVGAVAAAN